jgi:hypothetical protein
MEKQQALEVLNNLKKSSVSSIYSGKSGCMCGCKGSYSVGFSTRKFNNMISLAEKEVEVITGTDLDGRTYISFDDGNKNYTLYYSEAK